MRAVFGLVLIIGLGLAGFAVYMVKGYFDQQQNALARERAVAAAIVPTVEVYAVTRPLAYGDLLTKDDVQLIHYAEPYLPEGVFRTEEELFPTGEEKPRIVLRPMEINEPVLAIKVSEPGEDIGITTRIARGMRAFAIRVDVASGVSGFLRPGDRVDIYWTGQGADQLGSLGGDITKLIETAVKIVAVDQTSDSTVNQTLVARTVTVEVTPQQVASLAQAQSTGSLSLALVGNGDDSIAEAVQVDRASLLGIVEQAPVVAEPVAPVVEERVCTIRTRKGADVVEIPIPCTN